MFALGVMLTLGAVDVTSVSAAPDPSASTRFQGPRPTFTPSYGRLPKLFLERPEESRTVSPVELGRVASGFGYRRARRRHRRQFHAGVDFAAERGTPVLAARRGVVTHIASDSDRLHGFLGYGNAVVVYHPDGDRFSLYAHLSEVVVHVGQGVDAGQKVGRVGNTTNGKFHGMASHLHFEVRERMDDGRAPFPAPYRAYAIDPLDWLVAYGMELGPRRAVGLACSHDEH